jgi:hypothetical protein
MPLYHIGIMIFISYSRHDQSVCDEIARALEERGHQIWLDRKAIRGGDVWRANIEKGIKEADTFVILLSPNISDYIQGELELAHTNHKKIIALRLKPKKRLPEGYDLILSGRHYIEMTDFDDGIRQLFQALGDPPGNQSTASTSLWSRAIRKAQRVRAAVANSDLGPKALKLGAAALAGAAAVVATVATINEEKRKQALQNYRDSIEKILNRCGNELVLTSDMTVEDYVQEFRPRVHNLLGQLQATFPPTDELKGYHADLVMNLEHTLAEYDHAVTRTDPGSVRRAVERVVAALWETLQSHKKLLHSMD